MNGEILENPVTGESMRVLESTPEAFRVEYTLRPHGEIAGEHFHPTGVHRFSVLSGALNLRVDGEQRIIRAGESATVPAGARHFQWNACDAEAVVVEELRPAARIHEFFSVLFRLARDGRTDAKGFPKPLVAAALFAEFADTIRAASLGTRLLLSILAPIAWAAGARREIERYQRLQRAA